MSKFQDIKNILKDKGYAFNRTWIVHLPSGNYILNSKLGGWRGLELWCKDEKDGTSNMLKKQSEEYLDGIIEELGQI